MKVQTIFLNCEVEIVEDQNTSKDLEQFASGLIKKFERLQTLSKELNDGSINIKNLKDPSQIANNHIFKFKYSDI